jgi:hypothetical protein
MRPKIPMDAAFKNCLRFNALLVLVFSVVPVKILLSVLVYQKMKESGLQIAALRLLFGLVDFALGIASLEDSKRIGHICCPIAAVADSRRCPENHQD